MKIQLKIVDSLLGRIGSEPNFIQILLGPRQVGKTTAVKQIQAKLTSEMPVVYSSADTAVAQGGLWIVSKWEEARSLSRQSSAKNALLILDEVQLVEDWQRTVKSLWDEDRLANQKINVIITGSSALLLKKGSESLAGRFEKHTLLQWTFGEMKEAFDFTLKDFVLFGGYPGAAPLRGDETRWKDYVRSSLIETVLTKDIIALSRIQKPSLLKQLFELAATHPAEIVSLTKFLGQLVDAGNVTTLADYTMLLEEAFLLKTIYKYSGSKVSLRASKPKWIIRDNALVTALSDFSLQQIENSPLFGRYLENCIIAHLLRLHEGVYYWREKNFEVDVVLKAFGQLLALEIKSGHRVRNKSGLLSFGTQYAKSKSLIIGATGIPLTRVLEAELLSDFVALK